MMVSIEKYFVKKMIEKLENQSYSAGVAWENRERVIDELNKIIYSKNKYIKQLKQNIKQQRKEIEYLRRMTE